MQSGRGNIGDEKTDSPRMTVTKIVTMSSPGEAQEFTEENIGVT
jgi:hypothetical protein